MKKLLFQTVCLLAFNIANAQFRNVIVYNADSAKIDFQKGKARWLIYGPKFYVSHCTAAVANKYGFTYFQAYGCEVSKEILSGLEEYNNEMQKLLSSKNGKGWLKKCDKEMENCQRQK